MGGIRILKPFWFFQGGWDVNPEVYRACEWWISLLLSPIIDITSRGWLGPFCFLCRRECPSSWKRESQWAKTQRSCSRNPIAPPNLGNRFFLHALGYYPRPIQDQRGGKECFENYMPCGIQDTQESSMKPGNSATLHCLQCGSDCVSTLLWNLHWLSSACTGTLHSLGISPNPYSEACHTPELQPNLVFGREPSLLLALSFS